MLNELKTRSLHGDASRFRFAEISKFRRICSLCVNNCDRLSIVFVHSFLAVYCFALLACV